MGSCSHGKGAAGAGSSAKANYGAAVLPTDKVAIANDSYALSRVGEGELVAGLHSSLLNYGGYIADSNSFEKNMRYNEVSIDVYAPKIEGVSEKQINYAESVRQRVVSSAIEKPLVTFRRKERLLRKTAKTGTKRLTAPV